MARIDGDRARRLHIAGDQSFSKAPIKFSHLNLIPGQKNGVLAERNLEEKKNLQLAFNPINTLTNIIASKAFRGGQAGLDDDLDVDQ